MCVSNFNQSKVGSDPGSEELVKIEPETVECVFLSKITPFTIGPTLGVILDDFKVFRLNLENFFRSSLPIMF
jgi:hypothetical protein